MAAVQCAGVISTRLCISKLSADVTHFCVITLHKISNGTSKETAVTVLNSHFFGHISETYVFSFVATVSICCCILRVLVSIFAVGDIY